MRPSPTVIALISASLAAGVLAQAEQPLQPPRQAARGAGRSIGEDASSSPPLPHSTLAADAYNEEEDTVRSSVTAYHHQLAAPALFANIAPGDRPPECPPCNPFNCVLPAFPCLNTGTSAWIRIEKGPRTDAGLSLRQGKCNDYNGQCICPPGFGGEDCSKPRKYFLRFSGSDRIALSE